MGKNNEQSKHSFIAAANFIQTLLETPEYEEDLLAIGTFMTLSVYLANVLTIKLSEKQRSDNGTKANMG